MQGPFRHIFHSSICIIDLKLSSVCRELVNSWVNVLKIMALFGPKKFHKKVTLTHIPESVTWYWIDLRVYRSVQSYQSSRVVNSWQSFFIQKKMPFLDFKHFCWILYEGYTYLGCCRNSCYPSMVLKSQALAVLRMALFVLFK